MTATHRKDSQELASKRRALEMARRTLAILEEQAAAYTPLTIPAYLRIDLEEQQEKVARLEKEIGSLKAREKKSSGGWWLVIGIMVFVLYLCSRQPVHTFTTVTLPVASGQLSDLFSPVPTQMLIVNGVLLELRAESPFLETQSAINPTAAPQYHIPVSIPNPIKVHVLLTLKDGFQTFQGSTVGRVWFANATGDRRHVDLVAGQNIREWFVGSNAGVISQTTDPQVHLAWQNTDAAGQVIKVIDMLSVLLPQEWHSDRLTEITLEDISQQSVHSPDPALLLFGIVVECSEE